MDLDYKSDFSNLQLSSYIPNSFLLRSFCPIGIHTVRHSTSFRTGPQGYAPEPEKNSFTKPDEWSFGQK